MTAYPNLIADISWVVWEDLLFFRANVIATEIETVVSMEIETVVCFQNALALIVLFLHVRIEPTAVVSSRSSKQKEKGQQDNIQKNSTDKEQASVTIDKVKA